MPKSNVVPIKRTRRQQSPLPVYLQTLAPSGRRSMKSYLKTAITLLNKRATIDTFDWCSLRYEDLVKIRFKLLNHDKSINTINSTISALRGIIRVAFNMGLIDADTMLRVTAIKSVKGETLPAGRALSKEEVRQLLKKSCSGKDQISIRNCAMIYVLVDTGIRRDELANLLVTDYCPKTCQLTIRRGKGKRQRMLPLSKRASTKLSLWIKLLKYSKSEIFVRIRKGGRITAAPLSTQAVYDVVRKTSNKAEIGGCTPHDLRRTFITNQLAMGIDLGTVSKLAGHQDLSTTMIYDRRTH